MLVGMFEKNLSEVRSAFLVGVALNFLTLGGTISKTTHFDTFILSVVLKMIASNTSHSGVNFMKILS